MKALVNLSRRKPLIISLVILIGIIIFSSSFIIRKNKIASNNEFQEQSLGVSTVTDPLDNAPIMLDLILKGENLEVVIGSEKDGSCLLQSSAEALSTTADKSKCIFEEIDISVDQISVTFRSDDQAEVGTGKIRF